MFTLVTGLEEENIEKSIIWIIQGFQLFTLSSATSSTQNWKLSKWNSAVCSLCLRFRFLGLPPKGEISSFREMLEKCLLSSDVTVV